MIIIYTKETNVKRCLMTASIVVLMLSSCAHVISKQHRDMVSQDITFSALRNNPEAYINRTFILGGTIAKTTNTKTGTEIEVVQNPLDRYGYVTDKDRSEGRFLVVTAKQLDPLIYKEGRYITIAGKLAGSSTRLIGNIEFKYPLLEALELYLWKEDRDYRHYYYDPYFSPYYSPYWWYDPFWHRPYWRSYPWWY